MMQSTGTLATGPQPASVNPRPYSTRTVVFALVAIAVTLLSLRVSLWYVSGFGPGTDLQAFFLPWADFINAHGHLHALKDPVGDYLPGYYFLLALASYLNPWLKPTGQIKLLPLVFDVAVAGMTYLTVALLDREDPQPWWQSSPRQLKPAICAVLILALPSLFTDGALWGQCDSIYIFFLLASIYCLLRRWPAGCALLFGVALALKLQTIFITPFLLAALLLKRLRVRDVPFALLGFLTPDVPALLAGRDLRSCLLSYVQQTGLFPYLEMNMGNPWIFAEYLHVPRHAGLIAGLILTTAAGLWLTSVTWRERPQSPARLFFFATLGLLVMPYVMPEMHDRYMLPAEIFLVILACHQPRFILPAALLETAQLILFACYFANETRRINLLYAFTLITTALILCLGSLRRSRPAAQV